MLTTNVTWLEALGGSLLFAVGWMTVAFLFYLRTDNASWVDAFWGSGIGLLATYWLFMGDTNPVSMVLYLMFALWSLRISWYLFRRIASTPEDARYSDFRGRWGMQFPYKLFFLYQFQALLVFLLALPQALVSIQSAFYFNWISIVGAIFFVCGFLIESISDWQLKVFKQRSHGTGKVCDVGFWKYSRHPNYFGEITLWVGIAIVTTAVPWGWLAWLAPALITYFLLAVTGIPLTEAQNLRSKGEAYCQYQIKTSKLIPWFPRKVEV